ncbi:MAG: dihydrodipicolinate synthase family protein, partial [bacterium]|nr:dihydrodipicolinate synthase family protein [bacterium]
PCAVPVLSGDDSATLPQIAVGAKGVISVLANIAPAATARLVKLALAGDYAGARLIHQQYFKLIKALFIESNPIPVKAAMEMMGLIGPEIRLPLCPIGEASRARLRAEMEKVGLL